MVPNRPVAAHKMEYPSDRGIVGVNLKEDLVVSLTPKKGSENVLATKEYMYVAYAFISGDSRQVDKGRMAAAEWDDNQQEYRFVFDRLKFDLPGEYQLHVCVHRLRPGQKYGIDWGDFVLDAGRSHPIEIESPPTMNGRGGQR